ncbi:carcinoembryonic antigen-related cell adhesion molecule 3-like protein [Cricetulus griseus]|uniref:Carcinoembryonic antigen-related cell adhesion molecule 3-like protein n=1 Tax=Cricetulus griseus TaxID=10029 RepID=A0A061HU30_CRIGR|nr:carcinoembryonic antigen-related cell adhesion molecule 3-like protein [Cricetulus griseus]
MWNTTDRKPTVWGPAYSGRETLHSDGSLLIRRVTQKDRGLYTLRILRTDTGSEEATAQLQVDTFLSLYCKSLTSSQLMIQPVPPRYAAEGESVLLQVHNLPEDLQAFSWYKSEYKSPDNKIVEYTRVLNSISWGPAHRKGMVYDNGSLILQNVTQKDAGIYTLEVLNKYFNFEKAYVEFHVKNLGFQYPGALGSIILQMLADLLLNGTASVENVP